jgi:DNA (cytosine-5)-methyltransferase 1|tara:strand:- start:4352 stop:5488 length:1137 start_codon:yes stop_codon:yes gene_type:complete
MYKPYIMNDVLEASSKKLFTVISTFAGGGGSSTGYRLSGGNILCVNEFVQSAVDTYGANYPNTPILDDDIKKLTGEDFLRVANIQKGELDILDGSPPCSAFSVAGKREKGWDKTKKYSDGKEVENIEDLFFEYIRIANDIQPKVIIGENVAGIMMGEAIKKYNEIINEFEKCGYEAIGKVMNAADFGTPQARKRCFFVAVRNDVMEKVGLNFMTMESTLYPEPYGPQPTLKDAIGDLENDRTEVQMLLDFVQGSFQKKWIELLPFSPDKHRKPSDPEFIDINPKQSMFNMIRPAPNLPCPTVTQAGQKKGLSGVFHYDSNRKLTIKELKRVMGLPDDFKLQGDFDQQAERVGRMVAPLMMKSLSNNIYEKVIKPFNER